MSVLQRAVSRLSRYPRRRLIWRSLLAAPFGVSLILTLLLGPGTIDNRYVSFGLLAISSLLAALLIVVLPTGLLVLVGLATLLVFPLLAGLGFHDAPAWAVPIAAIVFYGSIAASLAAIVSGLVVVGRALLRSHPRLTSVGAGAIGLLGLVAIVALTSTPRGAVAQLASGTIRLLNMGAVINTGEREAEPTFSADGQTMIFNCHDYDICVSHLTGSWQGGRWSAPQLLGAPVDSAFMEVEPWLSPAGDKLYVNSNRPFADGAALPGLELYVDVVGLLNDELGTAILGGVGTDEIWVSYRKDGAWSELVDINDVPGEPSVNSAYADHCLAFSADGSEAFWTSTRPGGFGGNDIWTSRRVNGVWTGPENLGPNVNSAASEHHSMPSPDGHYLHITSDRSGGFGGEDIYVSARQPDGTWGKPVNLGSPINGPANDRCAYWTPDGTIFVFDSDRPGGSGSKDLWWVYAKYVPVPGG